MMDAVVCKFYQKIIKHAFVTKSILIKNRFKQNIFF